MRTGGVRVDQPIRLTFNDALLECPTRPVLGFSGNDPRGGFVLPVKVVRQSLTIVFSCVLVGCGGGQSRTSILQTPVAIAISPTSASIAASASQNFTATVDNASDTSVTWQVNQVTGGSSTTGLISSSGIYTAPAVNSPTVFTVTAVANANTSISASASVTVTPLISVTVNPHTASVQTGQQQQFTVTVTNTQNTAVTWQVNGVSGGNSTVGTVSASGLYTAPSSVPPQNPVTVTAISVADPTKSDSATVTVTAAPVISVSVNPNQANVVVGNQQAFTATVTGTQNTAVTWQVNGITGGNSTVGTISATGLYTAPANVPNPATVTVKAISQADNTKSGTASVTVIAALGVTISPPGPLHVALSGQQMFTATVVGDPLNQGVTWTLTCISDNESGAPDCAGGNNNDGGVTTDISSLLSPTSSSVTFQAAQGEGTSCDEGQPCTLTLTATTVATDGQGNHVQQSVTITVP